MCATVSVLVVCFVLFLHGCWGFDSSPHTPEARAFTDSYLQPPLFIFFYLKKQYYECKIKSKALQEALVREGSPRQVGVMVTLSLQTLFLAC